MKEGMQREMAARHCIVDLFRTAETQEYVTIKTVFLLGRW